MYKKIHKNGTHRMFSYFRWNPLRSNRSSACRVRVCYALQQNVPQTNTRFYTQPLCSFDKPFRYTISLVEYITNLLFLCYGIRNVFYIRNTQFLC